MKVFKDNKAYIQKNDIGFISTNCECVPASIIMKLCGDGIAFINDDNRYEFVEFDLPEEIEFLKQCDAIIDYAMVKDMSEEEIINYAQVVNEERSRVASNFNSKSEKERRKLYPATKTKLEIFDYKISTLLDVVSYKKGNLRLNIPGEGSVSYTAPAESKNILKRLFGKKNKNRRK